MTDCPTNDLAEALANCAREPVHAPGAIQPAGCLVCLDGEGRRVLQVSANIADVLGLSVAEALAATPERVLGRSLLANIKEALAARENLPLVMERQRRVEGHSIRLQVTAYLSDRRLVVEFEPIFSRPGMRLLSLLNRWLKELSTAQSRDQLLQGLVAAVHSFAGYHRIMVYQFDEQWHGTVISEMCRGPLESLLGHRFPASDIPPQVRALYGVNPVRSIPDASAPAVPLVPGDDGSEDPPLDMGQGHLRASSPVHLCYLANMGVGASLSVAIYGADELWGLLTCHHAAARPLSPQIREALLALVRLASQRLFLLDTRHQMRYLKRVLDSRELVAGNGRELVPPEQLLRDYGNEWLALFGACGLALVSHLGIVRLGTTPEEEILLRMASHLTASHHQLSPWLSDRLGKSPLADLGDLAGCCGLLALPLTIESPPGWFLLFREEQLTTHRWAGNPVKLPVEEHGLKVLHPRHSFSTWVEEVRGQSRPWLAIEQHAAQDLAEDLAVAVSASHIARLNRDLSAANRQLESLAHTDSLTGVWNRYHLEQVIDGEMGGARRYGRPCSLLLFDIDHFKQFNDNHGHEAGDGVLKALAAAVQACLRTADRFGRWGGEEFLVVAGVAAEGATVLAERIRRQIAALDLGSLGQVTVSIGVAQYRSGENRRDWVARADQAMYQAKGAGRNRVVSLS